MPTSAPATEAASAGRSWRSTQAALIAVGAGVAAYAVALLATLPARVVAPRGSDVAGTVWHGSAVLGTGSASGGATARWDASLADSLASGSIAARWTLDGPATALSGIARWRPFGGTDLAAVRGRAAWPLVAAALPGLPTDCTLPLDLALDRVAAHDTSGTVTTLPGTCGTAPVRAVPRLIATFAHGDGRVTTWTDRATTLATITRAGDTLRLHLTPAGAMVLPGPGHAGDIEVGL